MGKKRKKQKKKYLEIPVIRGNALGVKVYRGCALLCELAQISKADVYDQRNNLLGTQRNLSPKHARDAYNYIRTHDLAFWPEVFLCLRDKTLLTYKSIKGYKDIGVIKIDLSKIRNSKKVKISRVDGNHRLHYADGSIDGFPPIEKDASFCLAYGLTHNSEIILFRDINDNQKRMNTSHLDKIEARLTTDELLKRDNPALYIAQKLGSDPDSPFYDRIHEGGVRSPENFLPLRSLKAGIKYMLGQPTKLTALADPDAQYKIIRTFFKSLKRWLPKAWETPKKYLLLRGATFWGVCYIGASIIDRVLGEGKYKVDDMLKALKSGKEWDWTSEGDFKGLSGNVGAKKIRDKVMAEIPDGSGFTVKQLAQKIMQE